MAAVYNGRQQHHCVRVGTETDSKPVACARGFDSSQWCMRNPTKILTKGGWPN